MAHFAVVCGTLALLVPMLAWPPAAALLVIPVALSALIVRLRTVADDQTVTARSLFGSRRVEWSEVDGLLFEKGSWARAQLTSGDRLRLPAVTFTSLPLLSEVSNGRVPNPYG